jgi:transcriptional regulator with XRE-family HTH domain
MMIGERVKQLREQKGLSQGDLEKSTGMLRTYISRVENGHGIPSLDTLEKFSKALDVPLYLFFCEAEGPIPTPKLTQRDATGDEPGPNGSEDPLLGELRGLAACMAESDRTLFLDFASRLAGRSASSTINRGFSRP